MADLNLAGVMPLSGRVALVTGGGTGIRFNIAKTFAANGAKVYITGRRLDVLEKAAVSVTGVPGSVIPSVIVLPLAYPLLMDTQTPDGRDRALKVGAKHIENIDGHLDILVNIAGFAGSLHNPDFFAQKLAATDPFEPENIQNWAGIFALNTIGPFFVVRRVLQSLLIKGTGSCPQGSPDMSKAALDKLMLVIGSSFAGRGIPIRRFGMFLEMLKTKAPPGFVAPITARRHGTDAEMGMTAVYLTVSDYTNGAVLSLNGCASLVNP
ncbi:NAD(P)-binding protein [Armillaria solidipes]|uniref:NAD(P)-binding protein n=1 Tax=Armillaria solidipes TaxID=1076256 RepID=A0A2H3BDY8_9AGAR|nr:NAD(P)-binding protein [Armillaria solidipes]